MRAVVQRVTRSNVKVDDKTVGEISKGLLVFLGVGNEDIEQDIDYLADKIVNLRIFEDENEKMNLSLLDVKGQALIISQFTLYGDCRKGRRPNFMDAAPPEKAMDFYNRFVQRVRDLGVGVEEGVFQAHMLVDIVNDGPVTLIIDSKKNF